MSTMNNKRLMELKKVGDVTKIFMEQLLAKDDIPNLCLMYATLKTGDAWTILHKYSSDTAIYDAVKNIAEVNIAVNPRFIEINQRIT